MPGVKEEVKGRMKIAGSYERASGEGNGNPLQCFAWRIPGTVEPGGLPSMGSHRVIHN